MENKVSWIFNRMCYNDKQEEERLTFGCRPPKKVRCHSWPEINGLSANVWEETKWVKPWLE